MRSEAAKGMQRGQRRRLTAWFFVALLLSLPTPALAAILVTDVDLLTVEFRVDGVTSAWGFETNVSGSGLQSGTVTPAGLTSHVLTTEDAPFTLDLDADDPLNQFPTLPDLRDVYPDGVNYDYAVNGTMGDSLDFSVPVSFPSRPIGFPVITNPMHEATNVPLGVEIQWTCAGCIGNRIAAAILTRTDTDDDLFDPNPGFDGSWIPGLDPAAPYLLEVELARDFFGSVDLGANGNANLYLGSIVVNAVSFSTVPEPSTALLLAAGMAGLGLRRRVT